MATYQQNGLQGPGVRPGMNILSRGSSKGIGFGGQETDPETGNLRPAAFSPSGTGRSLTDSGAAPAKPATTATQTDAQSTSPYATAFDYLAQTRVPAPPNTNPVAGALTQSAVSQGVKSLGGKAFNNLTSGGNDIAGGQTLVGRTPAGGQAFDSGAVTTPFQSAGSPTGTPLDAGSGVGGGGGGGEAAGLQDSGAETFAAPGSEAVSGIADAGIEAGEGFLTGSDAFPLIAGATDAEGGIALADIAGAALCFVTEAVMSASGQGDGGAELETLRGFRDQVMMQTPQGQALVQEYEAIAPLVVEAVSARPDGVQIFQSIKGQFIDPAVAAVNAGNMQEALNIYAKMMAYVTPIAVEGATGDHEGEGGGDGDDAAGGMEDYGSLAAGLHGAPDLTGMISGGDAEGTDGMPSTDGGQMMGGGARALAQTFPRPMAQQ